MNPDGPEKTPALPAPWTWRTTGMALIWSLGLFAIYLANGREIWSGDSVPAKYGTCALVRGDGFYLDRYRREVLKWWPNPGMPYYVTMVDGHYVSRYPIGPVLVALPFTLPQMLVLDWIHPDWETSDPDWFDTIAKNSAAAITTLAVLALWAVLRKLGLGREAWLAALAAALGSNLWCTASQSLWQHGPAALMLTLIVLLLLPESPSPWRFFAAGLTAALLVCSRPIDLAFAVMTALWINFRHPRGLFWFLPPVLAIGTALIGYNRAYLGAAGGYYSTFDAATFSTPWQEGLEGTLLSPGRGLLVFSPWTLIAFAYLPFAFFQLRPKTLLPWLLATLGAHALLISTYVCWWAGLCFGPRFWTEVIPLLAVALGLALHWAKVRCRPVFAVAVVLIVFSIAVQFLGAAVYPSSWQEVPPEVIDGSTQRVWNWSDNELSRCIVESRAYRALFGPAQAEVAPAPAELPSDQPAAAAVSPLDAEMKQIALCFSAFRSEGRVKHPVPLRRQPLLRWSDPSREMGEAALWAWGQRGRPYALLTMELYGGSSRGEAAERWGFEFIMLGDEPLEVEGSNHVRSMRSTNAGQSRPVLSDRIHWSPRGPGLTFRDMPDAPPPAQTAEARLVQMKDLIGRFSATAHRRPIPLRLIEDPIDRYSNAGAGQVDGAIFFYTIGTNNPEVMVLLEAQGPAVEKATWRYAIAQVTAAALGVSIDRREVWSLPYQADGMNIPSASYFTVTMPRVKPQE